MGQAHNIHPDQLAMFMSPADIKAKYHPNTADTESALYNNTFDSDPDEEYSPSSSESHDILWEEKGEEGRDNGLYNSVAKHGVRDPVNLHAYSPREARASNRWPNNNPPTGGWRGSIGNGHHRLQMAGEIDDQKLIPVLHHSNKREAIRHNGPIDGTPPPTNPGKETWSTSW